MKLSSLKWVLQTDFYILKYGSRTSGTIDTYIYNVHYFSGTCNVIETYLIFNHVELPTA